MKNKMISGFSKVIIVAGGEVVMPEPIIRELCRNCFIIAADSGFEYLHHAGVMPDVIIGDNDSISPEYLKIIENEKIKTITYPTTKDKTDSELAVEYALTFNPEEITVFGASGTRVDHTLANIMLFANYSTKCRLIRMICEKGNLYFTSGTFRESLTKDMCVSIIPLTESVVIRSSKGLLYPIENCTVKSGSTQCVSNRSVADTVEIEVVNGTVVVITSQD